MITGFVSFDGTCSGPLKRKIYFFWRFIKARRIRAPLIRYEYKRVDGVRRAASVRLRRGFNQFPV